MRENQAAYLFLAVINLPLGLYINIPKIMDGEFPQSLMLIFTGLAALMMAYLSPHLFPKDERSETIIGRSMMINYFTLFITILVLFLATSSFGFWTLTASQVLIVLFCVMITAIPLTMVIYSKLI